MTHALIIFHIIDYDKFSLCVRVRNEAIEIDRFDSHIPYGKDIYSGIFCDICHCQPFWGSALGVIDPTQTFRSLYMVVLYPLSSHRMWSPLGVGKGGRVDYDEQSPWAILLDWEDTGADTFSSSILVSMMQDRFRICSIQFQSVLNAVSF